jgi:pyrroline-5-carboxylate reductase
MIIDGEIWLIGCGNMGGALLRGWLARGLDPSAVTVVDPKPPADAPGVTHLPQTPADATPVSVLILAIKPQMLAGVVASLQPLAGPETVILSVLAAPGIAALKAAFPRAAAIVRTVPNLPASIGKGITAVFAQPSSPRIDTLAEQLLAPLGEIIWLDDEAQCDAVTAVAGCGPAFLFRFADALIKAGEDLGLPSATTTRLVEATLSGSIELMLRSDDPPSHLAARVASPGGVTLEGLKVLDHDAALDTLIRRTLVAARDRSVEMSKRFSATDRN